MSTLGSRIKQLRKDAGMTQEQLANLLTVTPQAVSRWENNTAMPDISQVIPLANVFKVTTDTLLGVNIDNEDEKIGALVKNVIPICDEEPLDDRLVRYRLEIHNHPDRIELKEALVMLLNYKKMVGSVIPDPAVCREISVLCEDILETGPIVQKPGTYLSLLVGQSAVLSNEDQVAERIKNAPTMDECYEMLLLNTTTGKELANARKDFLFKCISQAITLVYELYHDAETEEELTMLQRAERLVEVVYGNEIAQHYILVKNLYHPVAAAARRCDRSEAFARLRTIITTLQYRLSNAPVLPYMLSPHRQNVLLLGMLFSCDIEKDVEFLLQKLSQDLPAEWIDTEDYHTISNELERLRTAANESSDEIITRATALMHTGLRTE